MILCLTMWLFIFHSAWVYRLQLVHDSSSCGFCLTLGISFIRLQSHCFSLGFGPRAKLPVVHIIMESGEESKMVWYGMTQCMICVLIQIINAWMHLEPEGRRTRENLLTRSGSKTHGSPSRSHLGIFVHILYSR